MRRGVLSAGAVLMLAACCPAPEFAPGATGSVGTGVVGTVLSVEPGGALLELPGGERLFVSTDVSTDAALEAGARVYVEGALGGDTLRAERIRRLG